MVRRVFFAQTEKVCSFEKKKKKGLPLKREGWVMTEVAFSTFSYLRCTHLLVAEAADLAVLLDSSRHLHASSSCSFPPESFMSILCLIL